MDNDQVSQLLTPPQQSQQPDPTDAALQTLIQAPEVKQFLINRIVGQESQAQQQPPQPQQDPVETLRSEMEQLMQGPSFAEAMVADGQSNSRENVQNYFTRQENLNKKRIEYDRLLEQRQRTSQMQMRAKSELPNVISRFGPAYQGLTQPEQLARFESYLDTMGVNAQQRLDPVILQTVAGRYMFEQGQQPQQQNLPPSLATQQGQVRQPVQQQSKPQVTPEQSNFAAWGGVKAEDFATIDQHVAGPKATMTIQQKRMMRPQKGRMANTNQQAKETKPFDGNEVLARLQLLQAEKDEKDKAIFELAQQLKRMEEKFSTFESLPLQAEALDQGQLKELVSIAQLEQRIEGNGKPFQISLGQEVYRRLLRPAWDVNNKPANAAIVWCTQRDLDQGMHEGMLLEYGFSYVKGNELSNVPSPDHMYCIAPFEVDEWNNVNMANSYLMIGSKKAMQQLNEALAQQNAPQKLKSGAKLGVDTPGGEPIRMNVNVGEKQVRIVPVNPEVQSKYNPNAQQKREGQINGNN